jgi:hypothetical protein
MCACLSKLVAVPMGTRLWFDTADIAALRQGEKERADTMLVLSQAAAELIAAGAEPETAAAAVAAGDVTLLKFKEPEPPPPPPAPPQLNGNNGAALDGAQVAIPAGKVSN